MCPGRRYPSPGQLFNSEAVGSALSHCPSVPGKKQRMRRLPGRPGPEVARVRGSGSFKGQAEQTAY